MNIFSLKKKQREQQQINLKTKSSAAQIRIQKDFNDLQDLPKSMKITFPDPNNLFEFNLDIKPDDGYYKGGLFKFMVNISTEYPHQPPKVFSTKKVLCLQKIYHPNIDLEGNVCLNILREDWKPVLNLNAVLVGLQYLFLEPNADDPLNKEAAQVLRQDVSRFVSNVKQTMRGGSIQNISFDRVLC